MKYKVIRSQTLTTGIEDIDQWGNAVLQEAYPKPGEIFEGRVQVDSNGSKSICGTKELLGVEYPFCFSPGNVQPVIAGIPVNTYTVIGAIVILFLGYKALTKK